MASQVSIYFKSAAQLTGWGKRWCPNPPAGEGSYARDNRNSLGISSGKYVTAYLTTDAYTPSPTSALISSYNSILLPSGNGYTQGTQITGPTTVSIDQVSGAVKVAFGTVNWTATGGPIGPVRGMFVVGPISDGSGAPTMIIGWVDFGTLITQEVGGIFTVTPSLLIA